MKYSTETARKLARQIHSRFGLKIARAVEGTVVPAKFVAGLISVEAGKKNGQIIETATRYEPHVFAKLKQVRDGALLQYNKIRRAQIADASDEALEALAKSYGLTQVMGWWSLHLDCTVAQLRDPETHLNYAVKLMVLNSAGDFEREEYVGEFRQWNSGRETGKTHDPDYVFNAGSVMEAYAELPPYDVDGLFTEEVIDEPKGEEQKPDVITQEPAPPAAVQAPKPEVTPVAAPATSIETKIAAGAGALGPVIAATGLKIGGVEFKTGGLIAIAAVIIVGMVLAAWVWNQSQERRERRQRLSIENLASETKSNVIAAGSKV